MKGRTVIRRKFKRASDGRQYRKLFVLAVEGAKAEKQYFDILNDQHDLLIHVKCLNSKHKSAPPYLLKRMRAYLREEGLKESDEAWLIVDKDSWSNEQLTELYLWSKAKENFGFALSNPKFEYWLLLHYEDGHKITNPNDCDRRLKL